MRTAAEESLYQILDGMGLPHSADDLAVLVRIAARPIYRPNKELIVFLARFPELTQIDIESAIASLRSTGLITLKSSTATFDFIGVVDDLTTTLMGLASIPGATDAFGLEAAIINARQGAHPTMWSQRTLGSLVENTVQYASWVQAIKDARQEVLLWVLNSAYPEVLEALKTPAHLDVPIKVLVGRGTDVGQLRGSVDASRAIIASAAWAKAASGNKTFEVRETTTVVDLDGCGSTLIDRQLLRFTIYDPARQRGSDGVLIETIATDSVHSVNLITTFEQSFGNAWARSVPVYGFEGWCRRIILPVFKVGHVIRSGRWFFLAAALSIATIAGTRAGQHGFDPPWLDTAQNVGYGLIGSSVALGIARIYRWFTARQSFRRQLSRRRGL